MTFGRPYGRMLAWCLCPHPTICTSPCPPLRGHKSTCFITARADTHTHTRDVITALLHQTLHQCLASDPRGTRVALTFTLNKTHTHTPRLQRRSGQISLSPAFVSFPNFLHLHWHFKVSPADQNGVDRVKYIYRFLLLPVILVYFKEFCLFPHPSNQCVGWVFGLKSCWSSFISTGSSHVLIEMNCNVPVITSPFCPPPWAI